MTTVTAHNNPFAALQTTDCGNVTRDMSGTVEDPKTSIAPQVPRFVECTEGFPSFIFCGREFFDVFGEGVTWVDQFGKVLGLRISWVSRFRSFNCARSKESCCFGEERGEWMTVIPMNVTTIRRAIRRDYLKMT